MAFTTIYQNCPPHHSIRGKSYLQLIYKISIKRKTTACTSPIIVYTLTVQYSGLKRKRHAHCLRDHTTRNVCYIVSMRFSPTYTHVCYSFVCIQLQRQALCVALLLWNTEKAEECILLSAFNQTSRVSSSSSSSSLSSSSLPLFIFFAVCTVYCCCFCFVFFSSIFTGFFLRQYFSLSFFLSFRYDFLFHLFVQHTAHWLTWRVHPFIHSLNGDSMLFSSCCYLSIVYIVNNSTYHIYRFILASVISLVFVATYIHKHTHSALVYCHLLFLSRIFVFVIGKKENVFG